LERALALAGPEGAQTRETGRELRALLESHFVDRDAWVNFAMAAEAQGLLSSNVARWRPCESRLVIDGEFLAVELTTFFEDPDLTIHEVKNILDPENWPDMCPFFCEMFNEGDRPDGWTSVLELVSLTCPDLCLSTALKAFRSELLKPLDDDVLEEVYVDYDMDDAPPIPGDGFIKVDHGYLNVSARSSGGVEVLTKKVVHISMLSPAAQQLFVCLAGYGSIAQDMILGGAQHPPKHAKPWQPSRPPASTTSNGASSPSGATAPQQNPTTVPTKPKPVPEPVSAAVDLFNECAKDVTAKTSEVASKLAAGTLSSSDIVAFGAFLGARIASDPLRFLGLITPSTTITKRNGPP
jgi:hypothetical protein